MHLAILGSTESWYFRDLARAAAGRHRVEAVSFRELQAAAGGGPPAFASGECDLRAADAVLVRTMPAGSLEQIVFRMDALGRLAAAGQTVVNPPRCLEISVDKYLATARLQDAGLAVPRTVVCQQPEDAVRAFRLLGGDVVIKPLFGSEGRGLVRLTDEGLAERTCQLLAGMGAVLYMQEFIPHEGFDLRVLVVGEQLLAIERRSQGDWRTNVSRGAAARPWQISPLEADMARRAAAAVGAVIAGVDLLPGRDGRLYALEVNAVPGWKGLAAALDLDIAALVLAETERRARRPRPPDPEPPP